MIKPRKQKKMTKKTKLRKKPNELICKIQNKSYQFDFGFESVKKIKQNQISSIIIKPYYKRHMSIKDTISFLTNPNFQI